MGVLDVARPGRSEGEQGEAGWQEAAAGVGEEGWGEEGCHACLKRVRGEVGEEGGEVVEGVCWS